MKKKKAHGPAGSTLSEMTMDLLRQDVAFREEYLKDALREPDSKLLGVQLRNIVDAMGGIGKLSKHSGLNRSSLYKALSGDRIPDLETIEEIFDFAGFVLSAERKEIGKKHHKALAHAS